ncbi:MAG: squalene synthase HpnC [Candidatus Methylacidiphilales bacterium]
MTLAEAYHHCSTLARSHYENFPVGALVPKAMRPHVHAVYAFARTADDIADEGYDDPRLIHHDGTALSPQERLLTMHAYQSDLEACLNGGGWRPEHDWIFLPVADTIEKYDLPPSLFRDLLSAFKQDIVQTRYETFDQVLDYCTRSANPVGRLVLHLHGIRDEKLHRLSDGICTGLQLANFWQDVSVDLGKNRLYIPLQDMARNGVDESQLFAGHATEGFTRCMQDMVERAWVRFRVGRDLTRYLPFPLSWEIRLTWLGGTTILKKIEQQGFDTLSSRPKLRKRDLPLLALHALFSR